MVPKSRPGPIGGSILPGLSMHLMAQMFAVPSPASFRVGHTTGKLLVTTPLERTKALAETLQLLQQITTGTIRAPGIVRESSRRLLRDFPTQAELRMVHMALPHLFGPTCPLGPSHIEQGNLDRRLSPDTREGPALDVGKQAAGRPAHASQGNRTRPTAQETEN